LLYEALLGEFETGIMLPMIVSSRVTVVAMGGSFSGTWKALVKALYFGAKDPAL
jgi:hypothetical protein